MSTYLHTRNRRKHSKIKGKRLTPTPLYKNEVRRAMTRVANLVLRGELTPKEASAIIYAAQTSLQSIRVDDQQKRVEELEALLVEMEEKKA